MGTYRAGNRKRCGDTNSVAMKSFIPIEPKDFHTHPFHLIGTEWMLITASHEQCNPMTASWGGIGILWHKPVATIYVRPQRYTFTLLNESEGFSLSFFNSEHKDILQLCGTRSGYDIDKIVETGLTPFKTENGHWGYTQARQIIECRTTYSQDINPESFIDSTISKHYSSGDYHRVYIGEVQSLLTDGSSSL